MKKLYMTFVGDSEGGHPDIEPIYIGYDYHLMIVHVTNYLKWTNLVDIIKQAEIVNALKNEIGKEKAAV